MPEGRHDVLWVVDFPMFDYDEAEQRWNALHHPFTAPTGSFEDPGALRSRAYDIVLDGVEIGGGSIRINRPEVQQQVFQTLGMGKAITSRIDSRPARMAAMRSMPSARPPCGGAP